jgi:hypothetical protein
MRDLYLSKIKHVKNRILVFSLVLGVFLIGLVCFSCKTRQSAPGPALTLALDTVPSILFLTYLFQQDTTLTPTVVNVKLLSHRIVAGKFKSIPNQVESPPARFSCALYSAYGVLLKRVNLEDPLVQEMEYLTEDQQFARKRLRLAAWQSGLRLQLLPGTRKVVLEELISGARYQTLQLLTLP